MWLDIALKRILPYVINIIQKSLELGFGDMAIKSVLLKGAIGLLKLKDCAIFIMRDYPFLKRTAREVILLGLITLMLYPVLLKDVPRSLFVKVFVLLIIVMSAGVNFLRSIVRILFLTNYPRSAKCAVTIDSSPISIGLTLQSVINLAT